MKTFLAVASVLVMFSSGAAETPESAVRELYAAFADGDAVRAVALLKDDDRAQALRVDVKNDIFLRCIEVRSLRLRPPPGRRRRLSSRARRTSSGGRGPAPGPRRKWSAARCRWSGRRMGGASRRCRSPRRG
jgi:hypothetical protein